MDISDDREVYKLSKLLQIFDDKKSSSFLYEYWVGANKLRYLPKVLRGSHPSVASNEVQYVIAIESLLENLINKLIVFIKEPYCSSVKSTFTADISTIQKCNELINELEVFRKVSFASSWSDFYKNLCTVATTIIVKIECLLVSYTTGKKFHFITNVAKPEDFIPGDDINLNNKIGKYFLVDKRDD